MFFKVSLALACSLTDLHSQSLVQKKRSPAVADTDGSMPLEKKKKKKKKTTAADIVSSFPSTPLPWKNTYPCYSITKHPLVI